VLTQKLFPATGPERLWFCVTGGGPCIILRPSVIQRIPVTTEEEKTGEGSDYRKLVEAGNAEEGEGWAWRASDDWREMWWREEERREEEKKVTYSALPDLHYWSIESWGWWWAEEEVIWRAPWEAGELQWREACSDLFIVLFCGENCCERPTVKWPVPAGPVGGNESCEEIVIRSLAKKCERKRIWPVNTVKKGWYSIDRNPVWPAKKKVKA